MTKITGKNDKRLISINDCASDGFSPNGFPFFLLVQREFLFRSAMPCRTEQEQSCEESQVPAPRQRDSGTPFLPISSVKNHRRYVLTGHVKNWGRLLVISLVILVVFGTIWSLHMLTASSQSERATSKTLDLSVTGAVSGPLVITTVLTCGRGNDNPGFYIVQANGHINDNNFIFSLVIPAYNGPGNYQASDGTQVSLERITSQIGKQITWSDIQQRGVVTVNSNELSGSVTSTLFANKDGSQIHLVGSWICH